MLGTFLCAYLIRTFGWTSIFLVGGVAPLLVATALLIWMPESRQLRPADEPAGAPPIASLFSSERRAETLLLWFAFAAMFGSTVTVFSWAPTIMRDHGIPLSRAAVILGIGGIGSLCGSASAGFLMERFRPTTLLAVTSILGALAASCIGHAAGSQPAVVADLVVTGYLVAGVGVAGLLALAAGTYPNAMRSTGVGGAAGFGRFGQVVLPLVTGAMLFAGLNSNSIFLAIGLVVLLGAVAISLLRWYGTTSRARVAG